ncbi:MAG TPA: DnaJ C-terminal domain-containing protein [Candidatus Dormibacteraeota bacterium]|nr:DnaJ C-terminal domain-containing protein [Candidatus Dormibacteraeota bacterium]
MATGVRDYYEVLGVPRTADEQQIKAAFRRLAMRYHPDRNPGDPSAAERFKEINEAYAVLSDPEKRRQYDRFGPDWQRFQGAGEGSGAPFGGVHVEYRDLSPEDLDDLFGGESPFGSLFHDLFGSGFRRPDTGARGSDVEAEVWISLEEAFTGGSRTVETKGRRGHRLVQVEIPAGVRDGTRLRVAGQGERGPAGRAGDLYLRVRIRPHPTFRREGDDLHVRVPVPLDVAILGGEVLVPTLAGRQVALRVPAGSQNGSRLRLRGLGMPSLRDGRRGDLYAELDLRLPEPLPPEAKELAERLRTARAARSPA